MTTGRAARRAGAVAALGASPSFRKLLEPWLRLLEAAAAYETFAPGAELATDAPPRLYLLVSGEVTAVTRPGADGVAETVGHESPGGVFGSGLITEEEDVPVYRAAGPAAAYVWERSALERLADEDAGLGRQLATRLSLRRRRIELLDLLRRTPLFRTSSQSLLRWLIGTSTLARFEHGDVICREGEAGDAMFLIVSGEVTIEQAAASEPLQQLHGGDFFGEIALLQDSSRIASAVAVSPCEILVIGKEAFDSLYRRSPSFGHALRFTAELRLAANASRRADPELIWLVNDTVRPSDQLAALVADALRETVGHVAEPVRLDAGNGVAKMLEAGRTEGARYVLCYSDTTLERRLAQEPTEHAGGIVHWTSDAAAPFPYPRDSPVRVHRIVEPNDEMLARLARALAHRTVGVALGGGAAWGYAHVALLRGLERAQIPVDLLVGVSAGSVVGAFYASGGSTGLDRLVDAKLELGAAAFAAIATTSTVGLFLRRHIPEARLEELPLPLACVAVDAETGRETVFRRGSLATAVRASCSLPCVFGRSVLGGRRYLDACVRNNVPARYCVEADADFVIACDVVPQPQASPNVRSGLRGLVLELLQMNRVTDTVRSLYWLASDQGRAQSSLADSLFAPDLSEFSPWDFHRAEAIVERAEAQLDDWLLGAQARYRALAHAVAADG